MWTGFLPPPLQQFMLYVVLTKTIFSNINDIKTRLWDKKINLLRKKMCVSVDLMMLEKVILSSMFKLQWSLLVIKAALEEKILNGSCQAIEYEENSCQEFDLILSSLKVMTSGRWVYRIIFPCISYVAGRWWRWPFGGENEKSLWLFFQDIQCNWL